MNNKVGKSNFTITTLKANLYAVPIVVLSILIIGGAYSIFYSLSEIFDGFSSRLFHLPTFFIIFIFGAFLHELLHAAAFIIFGKLEITQVKLGFIWKYLTPFAHCKVAVKSSVYRIALFMPTFILGIIPSIVAIIFGLNWLIIYGMLFTILGGGDILVLLLMRSIEADILVKDHPSMCGCEIIAKN